MKQLHYLKFWLILGWGMVLLVVIMSLAPLPDVSIPVPDQDKIAHLLAYFTIMSWFGCIYRPGRRYLMLGLGLILTGIALEFFQRMTSYRSFEYRDMMVDCLGVFLGWLLSRTPVSSLLTFVEQKIIKT